MEIRYNNQMEVRSRASWLLFVKGDAVFPFRGEDIPGVVAVKGHDFNKAGKWSSTTYRLVLASGVRHVAGHDGFETGRFAEGLGSSLGTATPDTWSEVAEALGVSVVAAADFLRSWRPKAAATLDAAEAALEELEEEEDGKETVKVTVSFGGPSRRERGDGFWESPKGIPGYAGAEVYLVDPERGWETGNVAVSGVAGTVLDVRRTAGRGGGYCAVTVAVAQGAEVPHTTGGTSDSATGDDTPFAAAFRAATGGQ